MRYLCALLLAGCATFTVTAYDPSVGPRTATGAPTNGNEWGIVAVDPAVIPLGSIVRLWLDYGPPLVLVAADTGGGVRGRWLDVLVSNHRQALDFGRRTHGACWD